MQCQQRRPPRGCPHGSSPESEPPQAPEVPGRAPAHRSSSAGLMPPALSLPECRLSDLSSDTATPSTNGSANTGFPSSWSVNLTPLSSPPKSALKGKGAAPRPRRRASFSPVLEETQPPRRSNSLSLPQILFPDDAASDWGSPTAPSRARTDAGVPLPYDEGPAAAPERVAPTPDVPAIHLHAPLESEVSSPPTPHRAGDAGFRTPYLGDYVPITDVSRPPALGTRNCSPMAPQQPFLSQFAEDASAIRQKDATGPVEIDWSVFFESLKVSHVFEPSRGPPSQTIETRETFRFLL
eukprot:TRINITY_DN2675_c0_g1_i2.p1 TRINITY_DN2675_c0_g1~~TRINITY_DN2675_c0_g1_i2.p1  ORF type:complete len:295 (+),score=22.46 TRINITY_DN2675_c0_g1_i2:403-1287(+)